MSVELVIVTDREPPSDALAGIAAISRGTIAFDGPHQVDRESVPDPLFRFASTFSWLTTLVLPTSLPDGEAHRVLSRLTDLVGRLGGAVLDPQTDRIVWPPTSAAATPERRVSVLQLLWVAPASRPADELLQGFLGSVLPHFPEASPRRYDDVEPLQQRFDPRDPRAFVRFALGRGSTYWSSSRPFYGGSFATPEAGDDEDSLQATRGLELAVDVASLADDPGKVDRLVETFADTAQVARAIFAVAYVEENVIARRNGLYYDDLHGKIRLPYPTRWYGLPPIGMWLAWYGRPYVPLVAPHIGGAHETGDGLLVRTSQRILPPAAATPLVPALPAELFATMDPGSPESYGDWDDRPAPVIPRLDV